MPPWPWWSPRCGSSSSGGGSKSSSALTASAPGITATTITIGSHQPLTGIAAPGYDEIAPAANAYFQYVNAHGGIFGRKIVYKYLDDGYNPANTTTVVHKLVLQDNVYAIFNGLGTPTHLAVAPFLNQEKVPDVFVASGCECWNAPTTWPYIVRLAARLRARGQDPRSLHRAGVPRQEGRRLLPGRRVRPGRPQGPGAHRVPASQIVAAQNYNPANIKIGPQVAALKASGAQIVVSFSVPAFTALLKLTALGLKFNPQLVVSDVGSDPITLAGLLASFAKNKTAGFGNSLTQGIITDSYLPSLGDTSNSWIQLFTKVHSTYIPKLPLDGNVGYGLAVGYTFVQAMFKAGRNPTRQDLRQRDQRRPAAGSLRSALRLLVHQPQRHHRCLHGEDRERRARSARPDAGHGHDRVRRIHDPADSARRPGVRNPVALTGP